MTEPTGEEMTVVFPLPEITAIQPFPALRDAWEPRRTIAPQGASQLPLWRSQPPSYGFREALAELSHEEGDRIRQAIARVLGRRLAHREATVNEVLEIISALV